MNVPHSARSHRPLNRAGAAVVELALCLPLLLLLTFGAIEAANAIYLKQVLTTAAYEGARAASLSGQTEDDVLDRCEEVLKARKVADAQVTVSPPITALFTAGTPVTITVTAPASSNSIGPQWYFKSATLRSSVTMSRQ